MGQGFPSPQEREPGGPGIQQPGQGGLMAWLKINFPTVYIKVKNTPRDGVYDRKSSDFGKQFPGRNGRVP